MNNSKVKGQKAKPQLKTQSFCLLGCGFDLCDLSFAFRLLRFDLLN
jgi:hypothetical protein